MGTVSTRIELAVKDRMHLSWLPGDMTPIERQRFIVLALAGEAGEIANVYKKEWRGDKIDLIAQRAKILEEMADVGNYLAMLAEELEVDLDTVRLAKYEEVEKRPEFVEMAEKQTLAQPKLLSINEARVENGYPPIPNHGMSDDYGNT